MNIFLKLLENIECYRIWDDHIEMVTKIRSKDLDINQECTLKLLYELENNTYVTGNPCLPTKKEQMSIVSEATSTLNYTSSILIIILAVLICLAIYKYIVNKCKKSDIPYFSNIIPNLHCLQRIPEELPRYSTKDMSTATQSSRV